MIVMVHAKFYVYVAEQLCLIFLSNVSSAENLILHQCSFIGFAICSTLHMVLMCTLYSRVIGSRAAASIPADPAFAFSYTWKYRSMIANLGFIACAGVFYVRHQQYCEPNIYSWFAICEYLFVLTNILFHCSILIEGRHWRLKIVVEPPADKES
jgi:hypothetical protein